MRKDESRVLGLLASVMLLGLAGPGRAAEPPPAGSSGQKPFPVIDYGGHTAVIRKVLFSHDGRFLVSAGDDKLVRVWSVESGEIVRTLRGQIQPGSEGKIFAAALSPDDRYLAVGGFLTPEGDIRLHDFQTGEVVAVFHGHENVVHALAFSPDGRELASGSADRTVRLWDVASRKLLRVLPQHDGSVSTVAFSPDGALVVSGSFDHALRLWDANTGRLIREMPGHTDRVRSAVFSRDGRFIASGGNDSSVRLWSGSSGDFVKELGRGNDPVIGLEFTPDGRLLAGNVQGFNSATLLSVPGGKRLVRFDKHDNTVTALAISSDGKIAATAGGDAQEIYLWDLATGAVIRKLVGRGRPVWSVGFAPDGRSIAFGTTSWPKDSTDRGPQLNDRGSLEQILVLDRGEELGVSLGGKVENEATFLRARDRFGASQLKTKSGGNDPVLQVIRDGGVLEIKRDSTSGYDHRCFTWTPNGKQIVSGGAGGALILYDGKTGQEVRRLVGHTSDVFAVAVSADGKRLVSGSYDQTVRLWDMAMGTNLLTVFVATDGEWVAWTPDGYYTSSLHGDRYIGWHVNQGAGHAAAFYSAAQFEQLYRPDVVAEYLKDGDIQKALARANLRRGPGVAPAPAAASIEAILPPRIDVPESLRDGLEVEKEDLNVKAAALSSNLPITDLRVTVNGIQVAGGSTGTTKGKPLQREIEAEVTLRPGDNVLTFQAAHAKARSQTLVRHVIYHPLPGAVPARPAKPNLILLAIGISNYTDPPLLLHWAAADAQQVFDSFKRQEGKLFEHVEARLLAAGKDHAGQSEISAALQWFEGLQGAPSDLRILFLSGHGTLDEHRNFYFVSQDQAADKDPKLAGIGWSRFLASLTNGRGIPILMVDACHAAAAANGPARADLTEVVKSYKTANIVAFTASRSDELSLEREDWGGGHGAFTAALLEGLAGKADGFIGGEKDGKVDTLELSAWLITRVPKLTEKQQHALFNSGEAPPFPLVQVEP
jgi:WD40 repeat protein